MTATPSTVYEVRCERCKTSFAPETRRCVHCGGPVGRGRLFAAMQGAPPLDRGGAEEVDEDIGAAPRSRLWMAMVAMAVLASLLRTCTGGTG